MKQNNEWKISLSFGIVTAAMTVLTGLLFIFQCADIYYSGVDGGGDIFTYEIVSQRLKLLLIPTAIWVVSIVVGYVISTVIPRANTAKRRRDQAAPANGNVKKWEIARIVVWSVCSAFALAAAIVSIVYLTNLSHFSGLDVNSEILTMLARVLPWILVAFVLMIGAVIFQCVTVAKKLPTEGKNIDFSYWGKVGAFFNSKIFIYVIRCVVASLAVIFIVLGVINGGKDDVLMKAINICTECIGLG